MLTFMAACAHADGEYPIGASAIGSGGERSAAEILPDYILQKKSYRLGRTVDYNDIKAWDIDIRYDGAGLPASSGTVEAGEALYDQQCASCHGDFGQGEGRWPVLVGGFETLTHQGGQSRPEKTVGSYWPYAATLFDYIRRAMPYNAPQSLSDEETYAIVAYLLYLNDLVQDDFVADAQSIANFEMPNRDNFFLDPRPDVVVEACMNDCLDDDAILLIESIKGVTPQQQHSSEMATAAPADDGAQDEEVAAAYRQSCAVCHDSGVADAPAPGDKAEWERRLQDNGGFDGLVQSSINGKNGMPPRGGAAHLDDEAIAELVKYIIH